ncbi:MAG: hypothetical protein U9O98_06865 [Asgard group archaeon]|nr:hypothetical protein [Asgard group archaeon]
MREIKTSDEWAFFLFFMGGILLILNAIAGLVIGIYEGEDILILGGTGFFVFANQLWGIITGAIINLVIGILSFFAGLKLFAKPFWNIMTKIDVALTSLILMLLGLATFTLGGLIIFSGGVFGFLYRLSVKGANNPKAK